MTHTHRGTISHSQPSSKQSVSPSHTPCKQTLYRSHTLYTESLSRSDSLSRSLKFWQNHTLAFGHPPPSLCLALVSSTFLLSHPTIQPCLSKSPKKSALGCRDVVWVGTSVSSMHPLTVKHRRLLSNNIPTRSPITSFTPR